MGKVLKSKENVISNQQHPHESQVCDGVCLSPQYQGRKSGSMISWATSLVEMTVRFNESPCLKA